MLINGKTLGESKIGYVFQNYRDALFPWLRAIDNIKYPLKVAGLSALKCKVRVEELVSLFDTKIDLTRYPYELSGGQQQLVSIMRTLANYPEVLFLHEPFSALDYEATLSILNKLQEVFATSGVTMVMVSHNLEEAVYMADRILLLTKRPTQIAEEVAFNTARRRTAATLSNPEFIRVKAHCLEVFQQEVYRSLVKNCCSSLLLAAILPFLITVLTTGAVAIASVTHRYSESTFYYRVAV